MKFKSVIVILLLCFALLTACEKAEEETGYVGYVEAEWRYIAAPGSGWLVARPAREGMTVNIGDLLFELDDDLEQVAISEANSQIEKAAAEAENLSTGARPAEIRALEAQLAEAQARLTQVSSERDRVLPLVERGLEPANRRDQVEANFDVAAAAVNAARENIEVGQMAARNALRTAADATLRTAEAARTSAEVRLAKRSVAAAVNGTVTEVFQHVGEFVTMGTPVLAIQPDDALKIRFFVAHNELTQFSLGQTVAVQSEGLTRPINATVTRIATEAEFTPPVIYSEAVRDKLVFMIEAILPPGSGLLPGIAVDVDST